MACRSRDARARSYLMVVRGSAWDAASWTSRNGTPASSCGKLAIFSAADDGAGPHSVALVNARPGPIPAVHGPPAREVDPGLLISAPRDGYKLKVRWHTQLDQDTCFARWLLIPVRVAN